jgi:hypothetical protein
MLTVHLSLRILTLILIKFHIGIYVIVDDDFKYFDLTPVQYFISLCM